MSYRTSGYFCLQFLPLALNMVRTVSKKRVNSPFLADMIDSFEDPLAVWAVVRDLAMVQVSVVCLKIVLQTLHFTILAAYRHLGETSNSPVETSIRIRGMAPHYRWFRVRMSPHSVSMPSISLDRMPGPCPCVVLVLRVENNFAAEPPPSQ